MTPEASATVAQKRQMTHEPYRQILFELQGAGEDAKLAEPLLLDMEQRGELLDRHAALLSLLERHPAPHFVNMLLINDEVKLGIDEVRSYPQYVFFDISSICSVECRFCKYTHEQLPKRNVTLEQVRRLEWLKYVRMLNLTAGTAEAITNPQFIEIFDYLRDTFPHLHITLLTNGRTLHERIQRKLAGRLDALHVSMNASCEESYNQIIARGSWKQFSENMNSMRTTLAGLARPKVSASFVMMRSNLHLALQHLEFAHANGAAFALFHHFYPHYVHDIHGSDPDALRDKFGFEDSLYHEPGRADEVFARVKARGEEMGMELQIPPPFHGTGAHIHFGVRSTTRPPVDCNYPWTSMYFLWGFKSKREEITLCCGLASDIGVHYDHDEIATRDGLFKARNSDVLRAYRRTVNGLTMNPICKMCREVDRFDPSAPYADQRAFYQFNGLPVPPHFDQPTQPYRKRTTTDR